MDEFHKDNRMIKESKTALSDRIISRTIEFGACMAGIANVEELKESPSHTISGKQTEFSGVGTKEVDGKKKGKVIWPEHANSAVVIAVEHPRYAPDMDWWLKGLKGGTRGNAKLMSVFAKLAKWVEAETGIKCIKIPYHIEHGGVFMKDTAVLAGLGCIGKSNILVTPEYGPRVRLRVMLLDLDLPSTGMTDFDPCKDCEEYCRRACPQKAFEKQIYSKETFGQQKLPGRTGVYSRFTCNLEMEKNLDAGREVVIEGTDKTGKQVKFCRRCEMACPVGR
ncbi:epoxyqueuosine reductase [Desulfospira joergensenii]|uniref:epoxyqueuosine reductase n=1 Tax=Desulfospira joergensenii TaxID=53329 RepID=UPI0003B31C87|nr:epoxyqueuosine reductase [Desulfospira joergensenii]